MTKKPVGTRWFVEPLDEFTNEVMAKYLTETGHSIDGDVRSSYPDEHGGHHQVWEMPSFRDVSRLAQSRSTSNIEFRVFSMPVGARNIREVPFMNPRENGERTAATRKIRDAIEATRR